MDGGWRKYVPGHQCLEAGQGHEPGVSPFSRQKFMEFPFLVLELAPPSFMPLCLPFSREYTALIWWVIAAWCQRGVWGSTLLCRSLPLGPVSPSPHVPPRPLGLSLRVFLGLYGSNSVCSRECPGLVHRWYGAVTMRWALEQEHPGSNSCSFSYWPCGSKHQVSLSFPTFHMGLI